MSTLVKIPLYRLVAGQPVSGDVYLDMPRNGKRLKILNAGECFDESALARFRENETATLLLAPAAPGEYEPETIPVHEGETPPETGVVIRADAPEPESTTQISGGASEPEQATTVSGSVEEPPETIQRFGAEALNQEIPVQSFEQDRNAPAKPEENRLSSQDHADTRAMELKTRQKIQKLRNALASIEAGLPPAPDDLAVLEFSADPEDSVGELFTHVSSASADATEPTELKLRIERKLEELESRTSVRTEELKGQKNAERIRNALADLEDGLPFDEDLDELLAETEEDTTAPEVLRSDALLEMPVLEADPEDEEAKNLIKEHVNAPRDVRSVISSLAVQLAQSLGYTDPKFLSDLALTALVYFAKLDGKEPRDESQLPDLSRSLFGTESSGGIAMHDTKQILFFLEKYLSDPDCDRKRKDLSSPLLAKMEKAFLENEESVDPWNFARWQQFAKRGTSIDMMTLCSQASTSALKLARTLI